MTNTNTLYRDGFHIRKHYSPVIDGKITSELFCHKHARELELSNLGARITRWDSTPEGSIYADDCEGCNPGATKQREEYFDGWRAGAQESPYWKKTRDGCFWRDTPRDELTREQRRALPKREPMFGWMNPLLGDFVELVVELKEAGYRGCEGYTDVPKDELRDRPGLSKDERRTARHASTGDAVMYTHKTTGAGAALAGMLLDHYEHRVGRVGGAYQKTREYLTQLAGVLCKGD